MKRGDLDRAVALVAERNADQRLVARLRAGERLRLTIGEDGKETEIVLAAGFAKALRADLDAAFFGPYRGAGVGARRAGRRGMSAASKAALAPLDGVPALADRLAPILRDVVLEEIARAEAEREPPRPSTADREIMEACRRVAAAADRLAQARFSGVQELAARKQVETEAARLKRAMQRHGRYTGD
jgi:transposase